jgi:plasmid stabilization system protein ParE
MNYTVTWDDDAEQELASIWLSADDRDTISLAAHAIDQRLGIDPANAGESRPNGRRITFVSPLAAIFKVLEDDRRVVVLHVWRY